MDLLVDEDDVDLLDLAEDVEEAAGSEGAAAATPEDTKDPQADEAAETAAADVDDEADDFPLLGKQSSIEMDSIQIGRLWRCGKITRIICENCPQALVTICLKHSSPTKSQKRRRNQRPMKPHQSQP